MNGEKVLEVINLSTSFFTHVGEVKAVRNVSFDVCKGEVLGIVGESGSGKSVTCMSVMKLLQDTGKIINGRVLFDGEDMVNKTEKQMQDIRGDKMSMIFQDPMTAFNPVFTIGNIISEVIMQHRKMSKAEANRQAIRMLELVEIPSPVERAKCYPHEFSGGMRQRAMIALALSCDPKLLIADEPTTALDVTIQAQVLELIKSLQQRLGTSVILITHDLGVVAETCNRVNVMYGGMVMEEAGVKDLFLAPQNPYTIGLMESVPNPDNESKQRLKPIIGTPPDLIHPPKGCPFSPRCEHTMGICIEELPPLFRIDETHCSRCWLLHPDAPQTKGFSKGCQPKEDGSQKAVNA